MSEVVFFLFGASEALVTYAETSGVWEETGTPAEDIVSPDSSVPIVVLSENRIVVYDSNSEGLRILERTAGVWAVVGSTFALFDYGAMVGMSETTFAIFCEIEESEGYFLYMMEVVANTISPVGNGYGSVVIMTGATIAKLTETRAAVATTGDDLIALDFDGTDWIQTGNTFVLTPAGTVELSGLSATRLAYVDNVADLRAIDFDGSDFTYYGDVLPVTGIWPTAINDASIALQDFGGAGDALVIYTLTGTTWAPYGTPYDITGSAGCLATLSYSSPPPPPPPPPPPLPPPVRVGVTTRTIVKMAAFSMAATVVPGSRQFPWARPTKPKQ